MTIIVAACFVYPLKSAGALALDQLELTPRGPKHDRLWLLVHDAPGRKGRFITQRESGCAKLALVDVRPDAEGSTMFRHANTGELLVRFNQLQPYDGEVQIWNDSCRALDAGQQAASWFSDYLGTPCRLVKMDDAFVRPADPDYSTPGDQVSFADAMPLLVANNASLSALNDHLPNGVTAGMERFRPNIVLSGAEAFEEDVMHEVRIGEAVIELTKPCGRCKITTIDQASGTSPSNEPLLTLTATRRGNAGGLRGAFFGQNAIPRQLGTVSVGDEVEVLSRRPMHPVLEQANLKYSPSRP